MNETDRYDLVLDMIEHPEKYTEERIEELLADRETREIYELLAKTASALAEERPVDVDAEWERFAAEHPAPRRFWSFLGIGSRAASVAAIAFTSLVAVAIGVAVTVSVINRTEDNELQATENTTLAEATETSPAILPEDSVAVPVEPVLFEDAPLSEIMQTIGKTYGLKVRFANPETAGLHLFYKFDPTLPVEEVIGQLNTFEQIQIAREGETLTVK